MNKTNHLKTPAWRGLLLQYAGLLSALLLLIVAFSLKTDHFLSLTTLRTISNQIPDSVMLAVGMTLVMIVGGIDLSVGSASVWPSGIGRLRPRSRRVYLRGCCAVW
jgi:ribose/xylose/arabinose/galactoside ABC-type transport system permease subunit